MGSDRSMMVNDFDLTTRHRPQISLFYSFWRTRVIMYFYDHRNDEDFDPRTYILSGGPLHTVTSCVHKRTLLLLDDDDVVCEEWEREEIHPIRHKDRERVALGNGICCWWWATGIIREFNSTRYQQVPITILQQTGEDRSSSTVHAAGGIHAPTTTTAGAL